MSVCVCRGEAVIPIEPTPPQLVSIVSLLVFVLSVFLVWLWMGYLALVWMLAVMGLVLGLVLGLCQFCLLAFSPALLHTPTNT